MHAVRYSVVLAIALLLGTNIEAASAAPNTVSPVLRPLDIAVGHWSYQGTNVKTRFTKAGKWTWDVDCSWAKNNEFVVCSFIMNWPEGPDHSVSLTTYNKLDHTYFHYEVLDDQPGDDPVVSHITIVGNTWTSTTRNVTADGSNINHFRVIYRYTSPTTVDITFQSSEDGLHWSVLGRGTGKKISP